MIATGGLALALTAASGGNLALLLAAADAAGPGGSALAPWLQGGGSAAAVAGLVYVARMIVKGDLVPRAVADRENETAGAIRVQAEHATKLKELLGESLAREKTMDKIAGEAVKALAAVNVEMAWWRNQRERGQTVTLPKDHPRER